MREEPIGQADAGGTDHSWCAMTGDFDRVASLPFQTDRIEAAFCSIRDAVRALREASGPPLPPARLTAADRPAGEPATRGLA